MITLYNFVSEKIKLNKDIKVEDKYTCQPQEYKELRSIIKERLYKDRDANLNDIDVSKITTMDGLFVNLYPHNIDISEWDMSNVTSIYQMFYECRGFNCDLSNWDVSNIKDANYCFFSCENFEGKGLENWNVSNLEHITQMFYGCKKLDAKKILNNNTKWNKNYKSRISVFWNNISVPDWYRK